MHGQGPGAIGQFGALALLIVAVAACSSSSSGSASSSTSKAMTTSSTTTTTSAVVPGGDAAFVAAIREQPRLDPIGFSDAEWIEQGHDVCEGIARGDVARGNGLGIAQENAVLTNRSEVRHWDIWAPDSIMGTAIAILCPQYQARWEIYRARFQKPDS